MMQVLRLFPDTNVFIQCRPLEDLDWSAWAEFDEVQLVVCRPVQREIDNQKTRGNDRVGRQARRVHSVFRNIIVGADGYKLIQESAPQVKLMVEPQWTPSPELKDRLDYGKPDDELVGGLHAYRGAHPDIDARLLTHDSGPMVTAKMLSLPFVAVPDDWLKTPESTEDERERNRLQAEVARLRKAEPQFRISCLDDRGNEADSLTFEHVRYEPLTDDDVADLMERLRKRFPLATDFGLREPAERDPSSPLRIAGMKEVYTPASDEDIAAYTDEKYPAWLDQCEATLRNLHASLQHDAGQPKFCFAVANEGNRPGKDALVTFTTKGSFQIRPPQREDKDEDREDGADGEGESPLTEASELPSPPRPMRGKWRASFGGRVGNPLSALDQLTRMQNQWNPLAGIGPDLHRSLDLPLMPPTHDPNSFYYKGGRSMMPTASFSLECDQWRHSLDVECFSGEIFFDRGTDEISGALECLIHAENLSDPTMKTVPVKITVTQASALDHAEPLVERLISRAG